jgi:hypothetical protein
MVVHRRGPHDRRRRTFGGIGLAALVGQGEVPHPGREDLGRRSVAEGQTAGVGRCGCVLVVPGQEGRLYHPGGLSLSTVHSVGR